MMLDVVNKISFAYDSLEEAFPPCDPQFRPTGNRVLVQLRSPKEKSRGGIILVGDAKDTEQYNTQVGKVLEVGSLAFRNRDTMQPWPEGDWFEVGDFVRVPKYGGDRWTVKSSLLDDAGKPFEVLLLLIKETDVGGVHTGDPTEVKAFL